MRRLLLLASILSLSACFQWKGDGSDEVLPDVIGIATDGKVKPSFGVPAQTLNESAAVNIRENRSYNEEPGEHGEGHHAAPSHEGKHEPAAPAHEGSHEPAAPHKE